MLLTWHGSTCIQIQTSAAALIVDPKDRRLKADAFLFTDAATPVLASFAGTDSFRITHAGEYELHNVAIHGTEMNGLTAYTVAAEGCVVGHLGALSRPPSDDELKSLIDIDILCISVGKNGLNPKQAVSVVSQIEPRIIVPLGDGSGAFCREMGAKNTAPQSKLRIAKKDLPTDEVRIIALEES